VSGTGHQLLGMVGALLLRLWAASWRQQLQGLERLDAQLASGERTLLLCWHGDYPALLALLHDRRACVLTNRSWRGQTISCLCQHLGLATLELPAEPGHQFPFALRQGLAEQPVWATAADGPLGPARKIKPPLVALAAHFGFTMMPLGVAGQPNWRLQGRWDKMVLPLLFSRVALVVGEPLQPHHPSAAEELQQRLERCHRQAEKLV
jgi:lysophospholipid acyltransferase (LPLAT)-like uncharacterized protein